MATYAISFTLDADSTYSERYTSLMEAIQKCKKVWKETTSFALVESSESLSDLELRLYLSRFDASKDILLVIDVSYDKCIARGKIKNKQLLKELLSQIEIK